MVAGQAKQVSTGESRNEVSIKSNMKLGEFCVEDPHFEKRFDIGEYFQQNFKVASRLRNKQPIYKKSGSKLESFYYAFVGVAEYLDMSQLFQACQFDPYWNRVVEILKTQKGYIMEDKPFFLYKSILMCKLRYKNTEMYRIIIPNILSHSFVYLCHRHYLCIKGNKLVNQIRLHFEIQNLDNII